MQGIVKDKTINYESIFNERGHNYNQSMLDYPHTRQQEFLQLISHFTFPPSTVVADIPSGGHYMKQFLPEHCLYLPHEPCDTFFHASTANSMSLLPLPISDNSVDITLSLAGIHHIKHKIDFFDEVKRISKPGAYLGLSDVHQDSKVAAFLDEFVGQFNNTGHEGVYLSNATADMLGHTGWTITSSNLIRFHWVFEDKTQLGHFCKKLFNLSCPIEKIIDEVSTQLGIDTLPNKQVGMRWELMTVIAQLI